MNSLMEIVIAGSIAFILFFAFTTKSKLARYVVYTILAAYALGMALSGMIGVIDGVDFLAFLVSFLEFLRSLIVFVELGIIIFLLFLSKFKTKVMILKVAIIVYVVFTLVLEFNLF